MGGARAIDQNPRSHLLAFRTAPVRTASNRSTLRWLACAVVVALGLAAVLLGPPAPADSTGPQGAVASSAH